MQAWPPIHLHHPLPTFSGQGSPKTAQTSTEVMPVGLGHLVLLEVSLDRNAVLGVQCPKQGQPQDAEQCDLHGKGEPSRAESWRQSAAVLESLASPYLWPGVAGAPGEPALPPPVPLCKQEQDTALEPKGKHGIL